MKFHNDLKYEDIQNSSKIIVTTDMLKQIEQYVILNLVSNYINYDFKNINIEVHINKKINIYVENYDEKYATITIFSNEKKLVSFVIEYILDVGFDILYISEYVEITKYEESAEEFILVALKWYPMILFYIQAHSNNYDIKDRKYTFFLNTENSKLFDN